MKENLQRLWRQYKELFLYLVFGALTTLVNWAAYFVFTRTSLLPLIAANVTAWAISVAFAYVTNRVWVFESKTSGAGELIREMAAFVGARVASGVLDTLMLVIMVDWCHIGDMASKVVIGVVVVITNYIFSKWLVFRKKK